MGILFNDGKYIRVNLDGCYVDNNGSHVSYIVYSNKQNREKEKEIKLKLEEFYKNCSKYCSSVEENIRNSFEFNPNDIKSEEEFMSKITNKQNKDIELLNSISNDVNIIRNYINTREQEVLNNIKNKDILINLGYTEELLQEIESPCSACELTDPNIGKINYNSMYRELKKLFKKEEYSDC